MLQNSPFCLTFSKILTVINFNINLLDQSWNEGSTCQGQIFFQISESPIREQLLIFCKSREEFMSTCRQKFFPRSVNKLVMTFSVIILEKRIIEELKPSPTYHECTRVTNCIDTIFKACTELNLISFINHQQIHI